MERKVIMTVKIFPTGVEVNLDNLLQALRSAFPGEQVISHGREYIGYGIEALVVDQTAPEKDGVSQEYEDRVRSLAGVGEISIESVRRFVNVGRPQ